MSDYQRLSSDVSETKKPPNSEELTPRKKEIKKLEESSDEYIKKWKEHKKEVGKMTVDFWGAKVYVSVCMMGFCCIATKEVSLFVTMSSQLRSSLFGIWIVIFLFPIIYLLIRRQRVKTENKARNEDIECEGDIGKVIFDSEKEGNEEYVVFYMDQLMKFNDVKSKEVSILEEEVRLMREKNIRWEITAISILAASCWICSIHMALIALHTGKEKDIKDAESQHVATAQVSLLALQKVMPYISYICCAPCSLFSACSRSIHRCWTRRNQIIHKLQHV
ncbi:hypothetical protein GCK72_017143 [Caenorhabditis remanei]|uniref:Uncharacterized protein n=1 Tax=Caenorhabditis remanei TaxID=31234 RepID=A0A6A5G7B7_CAERE|nr:hypothetical protein GCK72_017143 [Caenorhabditis remanei]KAF1750592.1 hypothetical protein GCK72_017143 [Caenorhabditis remanei]